LSWRWSCCEKTSPPSRFPASFAAWIFPVFKTLTFAARRSTARSMPCQWASCVRSDPVPAPGQEHAPTARRGC
jgi:isopentenyldiphosphate isomerase